MEQRSAGVIAIGAYALEYPDPVVQVLLCFGAHALVDVLDRRRRALIHVDVVRGHQGLRWIG